MMDEGVNMGTADQKVKFQKLVGVPGEGMLKYDRRSGRFLDEMNTCPLDNFSNTHSVHYG